MLHQKGINFNDYPEAFRQGTFTRKFKRAMSIGEDTLQMIPEQHRHLHVNAVRTFIDTVKDVPKLTPGDSEAQFKLFHHQAV